MKDKNVAGILALFFGWIGIHRFYLGQVGLGILYALLFWSGISMVLGLIDAIVFFSMDKDAFDIKYNPRFFRAERKQRADFDRNSRRPGYSKNTYGGRRPYRRKDFERRGQERNNTRQSYGPPKPADRPNPYKLTGIKKYRDYDYDGAIEDFEKALEADPRDVAVHFNLACAYSLNENTRKSLYHLDKAVGNGFDDIERIQTHDALAFVRIQPEFEEFKRNAYTLVRSIASPKEEVLELDPQEDPLEDPLVESNDLLDQLKKLGELRDKGLLTDEEFSVQKKKLLN